MAENRNYRPGGGDGASTDGWLPPPPWHPRCLLPSPASASYMLIPSCLEDLQMYEQGLIAVAGNEGHRGVVMARSGACGRTGTRSRGRLELGIPPAGGMVESRVDGEARDEWRDARGGTGFSHPWRRSGGLKPRGTDAQGRRRASWAGGGIRERAKLVEMQAGTVGSPQSLMKTGATGSTQEKRRRGTSVELLGRKEPNWFSRGCPRSKPRHSPAGLRSAPLPAACSKWAHHDPKRN